MGQDNESKLYVAYNWISSTAEGSGKIIMPIIGPQLLTGKVVEDVIKWIEKDQGFETVIPLTFIWLDDPTEAHKEQSDERSN